MLADFTDHDRTRAYRRQSGLPAQPIGHSQRSSDRRTNEDRRDQSTLVEIGDLETV